MSFAHPLLAVCALAIVPATYAAYRIVDGSDGRMALRYSDLQFLIGALRTPSWPCILLNVTRALGVAFLVLAAAGPRWPVLVAAHDAAIAICIDTSGSMRKADVKPTRAVAALRAVRSFVAGLPAGFKIGVISFAGTAYVLTLPAADRDAVGQALLTIPAPNGQTALGDGLRAALHTLPAAGARSIVLVTDGMSNAGEDPGRVVLDLKAAHVILYAIGVGESGPAERALRNYAAATGGSYARIGSHVQFREAFAHIAAASIYRGQLRDVSELPALAGLLLLAGAWFARAWAGRLSFLGEPELHEPLGHRDDAPQLRRAGRDGDRRRADRIPAHVD